MNVIENKSFVGFAVAFEHEWGTIWWVVATAAEAGRGPSGGLCGCRGVARVSALLPGSSGMGRAAKSCC